LTSLGLDRSMAMTGFAGTHFPLEAVLCLYTGDGSQNLLTEEGVTPSGTDSRHSMRISVG
jgi:hypothetical protein